MRFEAKKIETRVSFKMQMHFEKPTLNGACFIAVLKNREKLQSQFQK
jgi:hypothetical protein